MNFPVSIKGVLVEAGRVVLLENERDECELPGGRLEPGETPETCLVREFAEESGAVVEVTRIIDCCLYEVLPGHEVVIVTYGVERCDREELRVSDEHRRIGLFKLDQIEALPIPEGYRRSIRAWFARSDLYACIRNGTRESDFPHRHFFPLRALIDSDLPSQRDIQAAFAESGFTPLVHQVVRQVTAPNWPSFVEKSALRADSFLARLSNDDFQQGMAALRTYRDAIDQNDAVTEEIDWFVFTRHG